VKLEHNGKNPLVAGYRQATFSDDKRHRYTLTERIVDFVKTDAFERWILWVMCNPSTADAFVLDPTVTRCRNFSRAWGFAGYDVVNLYSLRTPYPEELLGAVRKAIGPDIILHDKNWPDATSRAAWRRAQIAGGFDEQNDASIMEAAERASQIMLAFGQIGFTQQRGKEIELALKASGYGDRLFCLGRTKAGFPKHPLARGKAAILTTQEAIKW
jgi:hypothetical protein